MLFHSLRTKVLRSLHNNTQQPVIYLVEGKSIVVPVVLIREKTARLVSPYHSHHSHKTTHLPTALRSKMSGVKSSQQGWEFYKRPVKTSAGKPSEDLPLMGREESEVWFTSCKQFVNTPLSFYSTFGAKLPTTSECSFEATNFLCFEEMPPSMHIIDGVET